MLVIARDNDHREIGTNQAACRVDCGNGMMGVAGNDHDICIIRPDHGCAVSALAYKKLSVDVGEDPQPDHKKQPLIRSPLCEAIAARSADACPAVQMYPKAHTQDLTQKTSSANRICQ